MILPSILEYSQSDLEKRLNTINELYLNHKLFEKVKVNAYESEKSLNLHLDFVLPQFAKDRNPILTSLSLGAVFDTLEKYFIETKLNLTIHLMGELEDLRQAWDFFSTYKQSKKWKLSLFLPPNQYLAWKHNFKQFKVGAWLDLPEWYNFDTLDLWLSDLRHINDVLIMTVVAGKSGQKLTPEVEQALEVLLNINTHFKSVVVDGGWNQEKAKSFVSTLPKKLNIDFVAYGGFWNNL